MARETVDEAKLVSAADQKHPIADINDEFNSLNANLVVLAGCHSISTKAAAWLHHRGASPLRRCTPMEGTIMTKSLLTGIALCTTLALFAGNANAYKVHAHNAHKTMTPSTTGAQSGTAAGTRVNAGPHGNDPLYESCDEPWKHPAYQCPGNDAGG
jgi:hypothetical protein